MGWAPGLRRGGAEALAHKVLRSAPPFAVPGIPHDQYPERTAVRDRIQGVAGSGEVRLGAQDHVVSCERVGMGVQRAGGF